MDVLLETIVAAGAPAVIFETPAEAVRADIALLRERYR